MNVAIVGLHINIFGTYYIIMEYLLKNIILTIFVNSMTVNIILLLFIREYLLSHLVIGSV